MTGHKRHVLTGTSLGAAAAAFSLAVTFHTAAAMPVSAATVHAAQAGISQVEKTQWGPGWGGPGWGRPPGWGRRRVCFWRRGRRVCTWR
jgi:hypothetical protein